MFVWTWILKFIKLQLHVGDIEIADQLRHEYRISVYEEICAYIMS